MENYNRFYVKQNELISFIRQSERERINLEMSLCETKSPKIKPARNNAKLIKSKLKTLQEEERSSKKQNSQIMRRVNNMEYMLENLNFCSEKLKQLKIHTRKIIARDFPNWKQYANELEKQIILYQHQRYPDLGPKQLPIEITAEGFPKQVQNTYDPVIVPNNQNYHTDLYPMYSNDHHSNNVDTSVGLSSYEVPYQPDVRLLSLTVKHTSYSQSNEETNCQNKHLSAYPAGSISLPEVGKVEEITTNHSEMKPQEYEVPTGRPIHKPPIISRSKDFHKCSDTPKSVSFNIMPEITRTVALDKAHSELISGENLCKRILKPDLSKLELTGEFDSFNIYGTNLLKLPTMTGPENVILIADATEDKLLTADVTAEDTDFGINSLPDQLVKCTTATSKSMVSIIESFDTVHRSSNSLDVSDVPSDFSEFLPVEVDEKIENCNLNAKPILPEDNNCGSSEGNKWSLQNVSQTLSLDGLMLLINCIEQSVLSGKCNRDKYYQTVQILDGDLQDIIRTANAGTMGEVKCDAVTMSMVILHQLPIIAQKIPTINCLLHDSLFHSPDWLSFTEMDVMSSLGNCVPAINLWRCLFLHFQFLINNSIMTVTQLAAVFVPLLIHKNSPYQDQALHVIARVLENVTDPRPAQNQQLQELQPQKTQNADEIKILQQEEQKQQQLQMQQQQLQQQQLQQQQLLLQQQQPNPKKATATMGYLDSSSDSFSESFPVCANPVKISGDPLDKKEEDFALKPSYGSISTSYGKNDKNSINPNVSDVKIDEDKVLLVSPRIKNNNVNISETSAYKTLLTGLRSSISLEEDLEESDADDDADDDLEKEFGSALTKSPLSSLLPGQDETPSKGSTTPAVTNKSVKDDDSIDFDFYD
ncbi:uncharacterized protein LOC115217444 [Argonauta hians]